jgi:hypothetical protein
VWDNASKAAYLRSEDYKDRKESLIAVSIDTMQKGVDPEDIHPTNIADLPEDRRKQVLESIEMQANVDREEIDDFLKYYDECKNLMESREAVENKYGEQVRRDFGWWLSSPALEKTEQQHLHYYFFS